MSLVRLLNLRVALIGLAALLGAFGIGNAFVAVFFQAKYEVTWNYDVTVSSCTAGGCVYSGQLSIANTGSRDQPLVTVEIDGLPPGVSGSPRILNLSSAEPRTADPEIEQHYADGKALIRLAGFSAGTLVQFRMVGFHAEGEAAAREAPGITVTSRGRLIEADPRALAFGRYVSQARPAAGNNAWSRRT
jgi:hypothetical protein